MRIALIALGSRGDVQPYIALARGLSTAGHQVRLITHENFAALAIAHGLETHTVRGDVQAVAESEEMRALLAKGNFLAITARTAREAQIRILVPRFAGRLVAAVSSSGLFAGWPAGVCGLWQYE